MDQGIQIIRANEQNIEQCATLFNLYRQFYEQSDDLDLAKSFISERIAHDESVIFLALSENHEPAGFVQLYPLFSA